MTDEPTCDCYDLDDSEAELLEESQGVLRWRDQPEAITARAEAKEALRLYRVGTPYQAPPQPRRAGRTTPSDTSFQPAYYVISRAAHGLVHGINLADTPAEELARREEIAELARRQRDHDVPKSERERHDIRGGPADPRDQGSIIFADGHGEVGGHRRTSEPRNDYNEYVEGSLTRGPVRDRNASPSRSGWVPWLDETPRNEAREDALRDLVEEALQQAGLTTNQEMVIDLHYRRRLSLREISRQCVRAVSWAVKIHDAAKPKIRRALLERDPTLERDRVQPSDWTWPWDAQLPAIEEPAWLHEERVQVPRRPVEHLRLADSRAPAAERMLAGQAPCQASFPRTEAYSSEHQRGSAGSRKTKTVYPLF